MSVPDITKSYAEQPLPKIFCPVCSTPLYALGWGNEEYACQECGTLFAVLLEVEKVAKSGLT